MKEQMNKKMYETPSTKRSLVEMEGGICATSTTVTNPDNTNGRINEHSLNKGFWGDYHESVGDTDPTSTLKN